MMRRLSVCAVLILLCAMPCAAGRATMRAYRDKEHDYGGIAGAKYAGSANYGVSASNLADHLMKQANDLDMGSDWSEWKLTREEVWLMWQAVNEYWYDTGDVYVVAVSTDYLPKDQALLLVVEITEDKDGADFKWYGGFYVQIAVPNDKDEDKGNGNDNKPFFDEEEGGNSRQRRRDYWRGSEVPSEGA